MKKVLFLLLIMVVNVLAAESDIDELDISFLRENQHLSSLDLTGSSIQSIQPLLSLQNLKELILEECYHIRDIETVGQLTSLEKLNISGVFFEDYKGCSDLSFLSTLVELKELDISGNFNLFYISPLSSLPNLQILDLGLCPNIRDIKSLVDFPSLKELITTRGKILGLPKLPSVKITAKDYHLS